MAALVRLMRSLNAVPGLRFHTAAMHLVREPTGSSGTRPTGEPAARQADSRASATAQGRERDESPSASSASRDSRGSSDRSSALAAADTGERGRQESGGGGLLPFGQQFPSLSSLLPSPIRSLFGRGGHDRDMLTDFFRDPFFSHLLPLTAGATAAAPAVSRGVVDVDAELANPIQGMELEETDEAYVMKTKLSPAIRKKVAYSAHTTRMHPEQRCKHGLPHARRAPPPRVPVVDRTCTCAWS